MRVIIIMHGFCCKINSFYQDRKVVSNLSCPVFVSTRYRSRHILITPMLSAVGGRKSEEELLVSCNNGLHLAIR
jgi:hypothetical protein